MISVGFENRLDQLRSGEIFNFWISQCELDDRSLRWDINLRRADLSLFNLGAAVFSLKNNNEAEVLSQVLKNGSVIEEELGNLPEKGLDNAIKNYYLFTKSITERITNCILPLITQ